jgi:hypothetical protein
MARAEDVDRTASHAFDRRFKIGVSLNRHASLKGRNRIRRCKKITKAVSSPPLRVGRLLEQADKLLPLQRFGPSFDLPHVAKWRKRNRASRNLGKKISRHTGSTETLKLRL